MAEDRFLSKMKAGKLALGMSLRRGPYLVEHLAKAGFDWFQNDRMHGGLDWAESESMVYAAQASGITPLLRINAMPWASTEPDRHLPAEVARAMSLGYKIIKWSYCCVEEVRQCVGIASDWHRNIPPSSGAEMLEVEKESKSSVLIVPAAECLEAINTMEEAMSVDGVRAFVVSITDTSRILGHPFEVEHPDVWRVLDKAVSIAKRKGIWIGTNTSYIFHDVDSNAKRVKRLRDHGVDFVNLQNVQYLVDWAGRAMIDEIRSEVGSA